MPEVQIGQLYRVDIIESERGWGQKCDEQKYFDSYDDANAFINDYNKDLPPGPAPDWYMIARGPYKV